MNSLPDPPADISREDEKGLLRLTIVVAGVLLLVLGGVSSVLWYKAPRNPIIMFVPVAILEWSFTGAMVSVLYRLAYRKRIHHVGLELYIWAIAKPLIGLFTGSLVYFVALAGAKLLYMSPGPLPNAPEELSNALWLNAVAFVGGFSDQLSLGFISRFVRSRLGNERRATEDVG
jgi:hypothetical protein